MDIFSEYKLPMYTLTEQLMDDLKLNAVDFVSKIDSFKVDRITMDEAEDNLCFQARDHFEANIYSNRTIYGLLETKCCRFCNKKLIASRDHFEETKTVSLIVHCHL